MTNEPEPASEDRKSQGAEELGDRGAPEVPYDPYALPGRVPSAPQPPPPPEQGVTPYVTGGFASGPQRVLLDPSGRPIPLPGERMWPQEWPSTPLPGGTPPDAAGLPAAAAEHQPRGGVHVEPLPYHRILRTTRYRAWRPAVGLLVLLLATVLLSTLVLIPSLLVGGLGSGETAEDVTAGLLEDPFGLASLLLSLAILIPASMVALLAGHQLRPGWLASVAGRMRWGYLLACLGVGTVVYLVFLMVSALVSLDGAELPETSSATQPAIGLALVALLLGPLQAAGEEYAVRGYLLQAVGSWVRHPAVAVIVTSLVFGALHASNGEPGVSGYTWFISFGVVAALLTITTGGLEAAIGMHVANNVIGLVLLSLAGGSPDAGLDATGLPWTYVIGSWVWWTVYAAIVTRISRRRRLPTRTIVQAPGLVPGPAGV